MYKLNRPAAGVMNELDQFGTNTICDSVFSFPEDTKRVASIYLNYLIYALILPCTLILVLLVILFILETSLKRSRAADGGIVATKTAISTSSASSTASASFDETNSSSLSGETGFSSCYGARNNNMLLWIMFIIHLMSSLPQEMYRYLQLNVDFNDEKVLDEYLTLILMQPLVI
jgi:hypothetical protein